VNAERKIIEFLERRESKGALQSEIHGELRLSKSTVSEILSKLEKSGKIVRERAAGKSYRVWFFRFAPKPIEGLMRIGLLKASEYPHALMAAERIESVEVYVEIFEDASELTKALSTFRLDVAFSPFITQTLFALLLKSIKIHCIAAYNGSGIALKGDIREARTFATTELSAMESNLKLFLELLGLNIAGLTFKYFSSPEKMIENLLRCEVDAVAIWEPYFAMLGKKYRCVEFREIIGNFPCCSVASNIRFYQNSKEVLEEYLNELRSCVEEVNRRKEYAAGLVAKKMGFDRKLVLKSLNSYIFSASIKREDVKFLERYGLKLTKESMQRILYQP
jgi:predicted transcriptional regulator